METEIEDMWARVQTLVLRIGGRAGLSSAGLEDCSQDCAVAVMMRWAKLERPLPAEAWERYLQTSAQHAVLKGIAERRRAETLADRLATGERPVVAIVDVVVVRDTAARALRLAHAVDPLMAESLRAIADGQQSEQPMTDRQRMAVSRFRSRIRRIMDEP